MEPLSVLKGMRWSYFLFLENHVRWRRRWRTDFQGNSESTALMSNLEHQLWFCTSTRHAYPCQMLRPSCRVRDQLMFLLTSDCFTVDVWMVSGDIFKSCFWLIITLRNYRWGFLATLAGWLGTKLCNSYPELLNDHNSMSTVGVQKYMKEKWIYVQSSTYSGWQEEMLVSTERCRSGHIQLTQISLS